VASEKKSGIAERYAAALFELADEKGELDRVAADLKSLRAMLAESADLRRLVASPVTNRAELYKAVAALAAKAGLAPTVANFLGVLVHNGRLFTLAAAINAFLAQLAARRGELTAKVTSATPLSEAQISAVSAALKRALGSTASLEPAVDPSLLGGLVVQVGSRMVDGSIKTKLQRLSLAMKGTG